ncbi:uncharacterized protein LOC17899154 isoform X2 [Capsella rubella]|uniref:uncharacterized protein LOC17899154 isoform X2 n=1 Tax=Capsella rubella TaxID=81985 RepID=UPI000CD5839C|nr:uncharacterized protein LOC17899154 isoform X2 [Capsella rubella]
MARKRKSSPGVRVVGRRIYDSKDGKSCHQSDAFNEASSSSTSESVPVTEVVSKTDVAKERKKVFCRRSIMRQDSQLKAQLPQATRLTCVLGIDIPTIEAANICQLFEFCSAFGKVLGLKEGQAETVVSELFVCGRNTRSNQCCSIIEMMIQLLDLISQDREMSWTLSASDSSWFTAIGEIVLESQVLRDDEFPPETFEAGVAEYEKMDASRKLKLLIFLCDELLSTQPIREYIKSQTKECEQHNKEAKEKAATAKKKEKQLKQKMQGDVAKAIMEKNGAPFSIEEHNLIISQIRAEANEAHKEMMEAKAIRICHARRTEPIMKDDDNGLVLWKLKCYEEEESKFLLQEEEDDVSSGMRMLIMERSRR